ncbi:MAG: AAA family ATPase, partial [Actinomycetales bacterium]|nr:AAA family ATPase [Actinomycetales bacterium]
TVAPGNEEAIAAALGPVADAVAVESVAAAVDAIRRLRDDDAGRAQLVIPAQFDAAEVSGDLPAGAVAATGLVEAPEHLRPTVAALLAGIVVVDDLAGAQEALAARPELVVATRGGDLLGTSRAAGGSTGAPSVLHMQAALEEARTAHDDAAARGERARFAISAAQTELAAANVVHEDTLYRLHQSDAALAAVAEQLGQLGSAVRAANAEAERARASLEEASRTLEADQTELAGLVERLDAAEADPAESADVIAERTTERDRLAELAAGARSRETESRLALRTLEERVRALANRAESLERAAETEREARERAAEREAVRVRQAAVAAAVSEGARRALARIEGSLSRSSTERERAEEARTVREAELTKVRAQVDELAREMAKLTDVAHRDEVARAQQQLRLEQLQTRAIEELGTDPADLLTEFGPDQPVPVVLAPGEELDESKPSSVPYDREEQTKRLRAAERALALLGRVNPLALEEFAALEERHQFLTTQLADLKKTRVDLLEIVREIDERVEVIFADAYRDTAAQFERIFPRLFPGGEGRLILTEPDSWLTTGIDVEARPAGKKVKRLSLLSGGERSLTAVAMLIAIFKARPSPFYVMDEVEAALDDANLGRLLEIFSELREDSQLIVVTHQKRTMEIADALYGVTMRGDGVTTVVSQRMREESA